MRWKSGRRSGQIEDRRGIRVTGKAAGGGIGVVIMVLIGLYFGIDPSVILQQTGQLGGSVQTQTATRSPSAGEDELADFVSVVLADTEDTWSTIFDSAGRHYEKPTLVLFSDGVDSACGFARAATGPFYCPADHKVYIDLSFYRDLRTKLGAPGDFAQAYVIAHEIGHHVQNLLAISDKVQQLRTRIPEAEYNKMLVRLELQADCFAGLWANHADRARGILETGDLEEALNAAAMIGDDRLQQRSRGYVTPDSFTHGTSEQRVRWFRRGAQSGRLDQCDTFTVRVL